ncbi:MAG: hypothetical protein JW741_06520 [Sedimentisphaerales bacterium]|nr:hypothetical protein [Sedimentisphaerales bacterium]
MVVGVVLGFSVSVGIYRVSRLAGQRAVNLERERAIPMIGRFPVILSTAGGYRVVAGPGYHPPGIDGCPFSVMVAPDRTIRVYGEIRDQSGAIIVQVDGESARALPGSGCDINSDQKAIEVVDATGKPVFQLRVSSRDEWDESLQEARDLVEGLMGARATDRPWDKFSSTLYQTAPARPQADGDPTSRGLAEIIERHELLMKQAEEAFEMNYVTARGDGTWFVVTRHMSKECSDMQEAESLRVNLRPIFEYPGHRYPGRRVK